MAKSILEIVFKVAREGTGDKDTQRELRALEKDFKGVMATMGAFAGAAAAVTAALKFSVKEAMEAEKQQAKLTAVLKSTGGAAGLTQESLNNLATELSRMSGIDDELIVSSEAVMLTFKQIGKQVFPEAMEAALNMNAVLGGDLQQSVVQLGKALNVTAGDTQTASLGLTAMRRSGVSFTEEQKKMALQMVKTGDVIGYQKLILSELNTEFGGAAEAMGDTAAGSAEKLKNSLGNLGAAFGQRLLPAIKETNTTLSNLIDTITDGIEADNDHVAALQQVRQHFDWANESITRAQKLGGEYNETVKAVVAQLERGAAATQFYASQVEAATQVQLENEEALKAQSDANKGLLSLIGSLQSEYTSFTEKNDALKLKLEELHVEQDKTSEWSSKYKKLQEEIDATTSEIDKLATEHEEASKRIAFSLLQQKLASDGLTDAEFNNLLRVGEQWGILDKTVVDSAIVMNENMSFMADSMQEPFSSLKQINQQVNRLKNLSGAAFDFFVNIHTRGAWPSLPVTMGGGNALGSQVPFQMQAGGGPLGSGFVLVGEEGPELITPTRFVIPADATRALMESGLIPQFKMAGGGILLDGMTNVTPTNFVNYGGTSFNKPKPTSSVPAPVVTSEIQQASQASQVANVVIPMAAATDDAVRTTQSVQQQASMQLQLISSTIQASNDVIISEQRETNRLLRDNNSSLPRTLAAVIQQALP